MTPEEWNVKNGKVICTRSGEKALDSQGAKKVADMARQVEKYLGGPQDIEWAQAKGKFYLLQARPITTLVNEDTPPAEITIASPPGFWEREVSHFPRPLSPMFQDLFIPIVNASLKSYGDENSGLWETIVMKRSVVGCTAPGPLRRQGSAGASNLALVGNGTFLSYAAFPDKE